MKPLKCLLGWHKWEAWKLADYSHFWWAKPKVSERTCECCGYEEWREV